jgi:F0F1-type ATP synthase beta subunit
LILSSSGRARGRCHRVRRSIEHYRELQDVISLLGIEELGAGIVNRRAGDACSAF